MISHDMPAADLLDADGDWLQRLARALIRGDRAAAEDLEPSVWEAALRSPPGEDRQARAWLSRVLIKRLRSAAT
jgi:DNA-directed RNA polymerase specialized sigma24 family protein